MDLYMCYRTNLANVLHHSRKSLPAVTAALHWGLAVVGYFARKLTDVWDTHLNAAIFDVVS